MSLMNSAHRRITVLALCMCLAAACTPSATPKEETLPTFMLGGFEDDYGIQYQIDEQLFQMAPSDKFHILSIHPAESFLILQNDSLNSFAPALFTRIDYQKLENMDPYEWAFCFSSFEAKSIEEAIDSVKTQKTDLMKGCNGYPFSRMIRVEKPKEETP